MEVSLEDVGTFIGLGHTVGSHAVAPLEWPMLWIEPAQALVPGGEPIVIPPEIEDATIGPELTAILGAGLYRATPEEAADAVAGFTVTNDVCVTGDWPGHPSKEIRSMAYKMFPTFRPVHLNAVTADVDAVTDLRVTASIDGHCVVEASTDEFRFPIPTMIAEVSCVLELHPGDMIALGEPAVESTLRGTSEVTCEIEGIGELSNPVVESDVEAVPTLGDA